MSGKESVKGYERSNKRRERERRKQRRVPRQLPVTVRRQEDKKRKKTKE